MARGGARSASVARLLLERARAAQGAGDGEAAYALLSEAAAAAPRDAEILHALGMAGASVRSSAEGARVLRRAVAARPGHAPWHRDLASVLAEGARFEQALTPARRAAELEPSADSLALLASILNRLRRGEEAMEVVGRALERSPGHADATLLLARLHVAAGRGEEAEGLVRALGEDPSRAPGVRYSALHLLGEILEGRGEFDAAFETHDRANRCMSGLAWVRALARGGRLARTPAYLPEDAPAIYRRWGERVVDDGLPTPSFLVGYVRSGTTMTEQILSAHPRVRSTDERNFTEALYHRARAMTGADAHAPGEFLRLLDGMSDAQLGELRGAYWEMVRAEVGQDAGSWTIVDKNPLEILDAGLIARVFPRAPIIVVLRDPRDACLSALFQGFSLDASTARMLDVESVGAHYAGVMGFWLRIRELIPNPRLEIRYEEIVGDFPAQARRLVEFVGLEWSDEVARFHEKAARRAVFSSSYLSVTRRISTRAVGRWTKYESRLGPLMAHVRPFLEAFGYEP